MEVGRIEEIAQAIERLRGEEFHQKGRNDNEENVLVFRKFVACESTLDGDGRFVISGSVTMDNEKAGYRWGIGCCGPWLWEVTVGKY